ncbi:MAG: hypothetical protein ACLUNH_08065 [Hominenteromicrobium sp.]
MEYHILLYIGWLCSKKRIENSLHGGEAGGQNFENVQHIFRANCIFARSLSKAGENLPDFAVKCRNSVSIRRSCTIHGNLYFCRGHAYEAAFFGGFWADLITKLQYYHEKLHGVYMPQSHNSQKYTKIKTEFP